jgi:hypothetical protein
MNDTYAMLNGRGYPETINTAELANTENGVVSQRANALVEANVGDKVLLRISNLSITEYFTLMSPQIPMRIVGTGARELRGTGGADLSYLTNSVNLGGGEAFDAILDTADVAPGTYFIYTSNLNFLSNNTEERGGIMTEIHINP